MKRKSTIIASFLCCLMVSTQAKPLVWIYTDMSDKTLPGKNKEGTINDPDDISAMAGYLLMCNEFETLGIVVASTHRKEHAHTPNQAEWAQRVFGEAYAADVTNLNKVIGGYPKTIAFIQSCIKESSERFQPKKTYDSLEKYPSVKALFDTAEKQTETINVLCWGSLTEPAILVRHCLSTGRTDLLEKLRFIAHWTNSSLHQGTPEHPEHVANCREDGKACAYLKEQAYEGNIQYFECGAIGQHGIVSGAPTGRNYFDSFRASRLGTLFVEGKFVFNCVDHSDSATYWTLLKNWGVGLNDIMPDGSNPPEIEKANEQKFKNYSEKIHNELLRRSHIAAGKEE